MGVGQRVADSSIRNDAPPSGASWTQARPPCMRANTATSDRPRSSPLASSPPRPVPRNGENTTCADLVVPCRSPSTSRNSSTSTPRASEPDPQRRVGWARARWVGHQFHQRPGQLDRVGVGLVTSNWYATSRSIGARSCRTSSTTSWRCDVLALRARTLQLQPAQLQQGRQHPAQLHHLAGGALQHRTGHGRRHRRRILQQRVQRRGHHVQWRPHVLRGRAEQRRLPLREGAQRGRVAPGVLQQPRQALAGPARSGRASHSTQRSSRPLVGWSRRARRSPARAASRAPVDQPDLPGVDALAGPRRDAAAARGPLVVVGVDELGRGGRPSTSSTSRPNSCGPAVLASSMWPSTSVSRYGSGASSNRSS